MKKIIIGAVVASMLVLPTVSLAANPLFTPAKVIKNTLERVFWGKPADHGATITTTVDYSEKNLKNVVTERVQAEMRYNYELQYRENGKHNARFSLALPKFEITENGKTQKWNNPIYFEVLSLGKDATYVRIAEVSSELQALLKEEANIDVTPILGQWISVPVDELADEAIEELAEETPFVFSQDEVAEIKTWYLATAKRLGSPLKITRLGRVSTNNAGEKVQTVRVSFNTAWYAAIEKLVIDEYKKENPKATAKEIAAQKREFNTGIAEFKKVLAKVQTDLTLNLSTGVISDTVVAYNGGRQPEYTYDYKYTNGTYKSTKKIKGYSSLSVKTTANFRPVSTLALEAPSQSLDGMKVWDMIYTKPASLPLTDIQADCRTSLDCHAGYSCEGTAQDKEMGMGTCVADNFGL